MAAASFARAVAFVLTHEGGYVDDPHDPGGATNMGITLGTLAKWRGRPVTKAEVRALTRDEAIRIYRARYWDAIKGDQLPAGVDYAVFDPCVNSGPRRAAEWLQTSAGVTADGAIGPKTLAAVNSLHPRALINEISARRLGFLQGLPTWWRFGKGWSRRVEEVRRDALSFITARS